MQAVFDLIWQHALDYQDARDDHGHGETVTEYAKKLLELNSDAKPHIVIPAAMLHDIGWSQLEDSEKFLQFDPNRTKEQEHEVRIKHQTEGTKLAKEILEKVEYPEEHVQHILEIVSQHDTREGFISKEDGLMRDADKLWRFSKLGVKKDLERFGFSFEENKKRLMDWVNEPNFFYSEAAEKIALEELKKREQELQTKVTP